MSVESKIQELLGRVDAKASLQEAGPMGAEKNKDTSIPAANSGDTAQPKQGDSQEASAEERDESEPNQGAVAAKGNKKTTIAAKGPVGDAPNFTTVGDPTSAVNQGSSAGNVPVGEETIEDGETLEEAPEAIDLSLIFGDDLSEDFRTKATSIFEAAVIARVNMEMDKVASSLEEKYAADYADAKDAMVEKIDSYLNYVVENYMAENELALENGLRTEIAEDFMSGLKTLFKEHFIEVPEEKYDVLGELQAKAEDLESKLDEAIGDNVELSKEVTSLKRSAIVEELSKDLADTEAVKLGKLLEGVEFESEELYREKVAVIKENYFPKNAVNESVKTAVTTTQQALVESNEGTADYSADNSVVSTYAQMLSRSIKRS